MDEQVTRQLTRVSLLRAEGIFAREFFGTVRGQNYCARPWWVEGKETADSED